MPSGAHYTSVLGYTYDAHGNITHISASDADGIDLGYTYDALNREQLSVLTIDTCGRR